LIKARVYNRNRITLFLTPQKTIHSGEISNGCSEGNIDSNLLLGAGVELSDGAYA
jgi:hypothetical protein